MKGEQGRKISAGLKRSNARRKAVGLLTINDLRKESGFSRRTIESFMESGALAYVKAGKRCYVHRAVWQRLLGAIERGEPVHAKPKLVERKAG